MTDLSKFEAAAHALGVEAAKTAASWATDGNTSEEHYRRVLTMLEDGDPRAEEYLPARPDLSGEWADAPTVRSLYGEVTGRELPDAGDEGLSFETEHGALMDAIADAWEAGVSETFEHECERLIREAIA